MPNNNDMTASEMNAKQEQGNVTTGLSMSLDGFIAGPNDSPEQPLGDGGERLFEWYSSGDTGYTMPSGTMTVTVSPVSAKHLQEEFEKVGALVTGRRTFDITNGWDGQHPLDVPVFVVTHTIPEEWKTEDSPFTFVTDGVESAVEQAKDVAGERNVAVGAASLVQQCLNEGLLDEIHIDLVPVLLGDGVRLFDHLDTGPIELEETSVIEAPDVTHLGYRVKKGDEK
ncbi:dihydrofolate reductase family protein [Haladaptatus halobius]|uniref:dihydrofolate reductase family protein n=1 Tax=Haladaptatus halobius TaxID=2884875 RepID=UPI001D0BA17A|nr:dihydrofolate reductase family protein [Haladaptatus halobius]